MNIPSLKQKAEAIRHRLEEVENHIAALEGDAHAMLGTNVGSAPTAPVPVAPALKVVSRGKRGATKPKRRKPVAKKAARKSPAKPVQPPVVAAKIPARKSPKKTSRKNGTKSPSTRKVSAVPASAPVVANGVGGVDGDFDALG